MTSTHYTPEELAKLARIPDIQRRLAEERAAWGRAQEAQEGTLAAIKALEGVLERGRRSAMPELSTAAQEASAKRLEPMNRFFQEEGVRYIRLLAVPGLEQENPQAYQVALAINQLMEDWRAAMQGLSARAKTEAAARDAHQQLAAPLEAEVFRVLGRGLH